MTKTKKPISQGSRRLPVVWWWWFLVLCTISTEKLGVVDAVAIFASRGHCELVSVVETFVWDSEAQTYLRPVSSEDDDFETTTTTMPSNSSSNDGQLHQRRRRRRLPDQPVWLQMAEGPTVLRGGSGGEPHIPLAVLEGHSEDYVDLSVHQQHGDRQLQAYIDNPPPFLEVRRCPCIPHHFNYSYFCKADTEFCFRTWGRPYPTCLDESSFNSFAKTVWMPSVVWILMVLTCLVCTIPGRNALECLAATVVPYYYNRWAAWRILRFNPLRASLMVERSLERRRRAIEARLAAIDRQITAELAAAAVREENNNSNAPVVKELCLKTRIYRSAGSAAVVSNCRRDAVPGQPTHPPDATSHVSHGSLLLSSLFTSDDDKKEEEQDEEQEANTCAICYTEVVDGDRVGVLACGHLLHAECLKVWLKRRNVCPLCVQPVAEPRTKMDIIKRGETEQGYPQQQEQPGQIQPHQQPRQEQPHLQPGNNHHNQEQPINNNTLNNDSTGLEDEEAFTPSTSLEGGIRPIS